MRVSFRFEIFGTITLLLVLLLSGLAAGEAPLHGWTTTTTLPCYQLNLDAIVSSG